ncbi:hypothetical protein [Nonomuraea sp. NPDC050202]
MPVGLAYNLGENSVDLGALPAALPVVIVFAFIQRYLVQRMSAGAVKG